MKRTKIIFVSTFNALAILAFGQSVHAASINTVVLDSFKLDTRFEGAEFQINPSLGRARIQATLDDTTAGEDTSGTFTRNYLVDGLSFDASTQQIVFEKDGLFAVCATVSTKKVIGIPVTKVRSSGSCEVKAVEVNRTIDDGFEIRNEKALEIRFVVSTN